MPAPRRLYIHVGLQKTGTSYLQSIFWQSQDELREQGLDMVPGSKRRTFQLMLRVRGRYQPTFDPPETAGALDRLPGELAAAKGSHALISEESLAPATDEQIDALLAACRDREVHVIVTVRDLGRQIPSAWQQMLQSGSSMKYDTYLRRMRRNEGDPSARFWSNKDVEGILANWARHVPAERIHVVTVPPSGSDPEALLRRFCSVLDVDVEKVDRNVARSNEGLGRVQAEVLRRVNGHLDKEFRTRDVYGDIGKRFFAVKVLAKQGGSKTLVPDAYADWCREVSHRFADAIKTGGYDVVGDLSDLEPLPSAFEPAGQGDPDPAEVADRAAEALATMLTGQMTKLRRKRANGEGRLRGPRRWVRALQR